MLVASPALADDPFTTIHPVSVLQTLDQVQTASTSVTITVPTVRCAGATTPLQMEAGLGGRRVETPAAASGVIIATCTGSRADFAAEPRIDYRMAGTGTLSLVAGDRVRVVATVDPTRMTISLTSARTGQTVSATGPSADLGGGVLVEEPDGALAAPRVRRRK